MTVVPFRDYNALAFMKRENGLAYLAFLTVCFVWGTTYLAIRVAIETLPVFLFPGLRFTLAGLILMAVRLAMGDRLPRARSEWFNLTLVGVLLIGVGNVAIVWAEHWVTSGFAALLVATAPFWMAVMEAFRRDGDRVGPMKVAGMVVGFAGVIILVAPELTGSSFNLQFLLGVLALQGATIAWNLGSMRSKYHAPKTSALMSAALQMVLGGAIVSVIGLLNGEAAEFRFNARTLAAFVYLVVFGSILAYGAYVYALSKLRTTTVSTYAYINPAVAVFLGWLILDEPLGWNGVAGMIVILAGVALVQIAKVRPTAQPRVAPAVMKENEDVA
ncbi:MAG: EamA family transporter [Thermoanaerobaculia bacterium]